MILVSFVYVSFIIIIIIIIIIIPVLDTKRYNRVCQVFSVCILYRHLHRITDCFLWTPVFLDMKTL